jgi:inositol-1,3,4-trisphosphate 5/6-kinase/inositol-tetrakisphosphate 1-kinase
MEDSNGTVSKEHCHRIGYALNPKKLRKPNLVSQEINNSSIRDPKIKAKWAGGGLADILTQTELTDNLTFTPWDPELPPDQQPFFHVIIHKLTEDLDREESREKIEALQAYLRHWQHTILLDPLESVRKVISRARTCAHLSNIETRLGNQCPFRQPRYLIIEENDSVEKVKLQMRQLNLSMPVICKPIAACGTPSSHEMAVLISEEDLHLAPRSCIMQQYEDHGHVFFKVYVIDEEVSVFRRSSLPDLSRLIRQHQFCNEEFRLKERSTLKSLVFDSRYCYPTEHDFFTVNESAEDSAVSAVPNQDVARLSWKLQGSPSRQTKDSLSGAEKKKEYARNEIPDLKSLSLVTTGEDEVIDEDIRKLLEQSAFLIQEEFGLHLFGFDVLLMPVQLSNDLQRVVVVDVNYFPSYKEIEDFPEKLREFLGRLASSVDEKKASQQESNA